MKFSLVTLTLSVLFVAGTEAGWSKEQNIQKREIHVPHPRLRRVYLEKVTKPDTSDLPVVENVKDAADKVVVKDDSKVKDLTNKPIELATTEVPDYNANVGQNDINKDLGEEPAVDDKELEKEPTGEEQPGEEQRRRKRHTYEGLIKNKDTTIESKHPEEAVTVNSEIKPTTLKKVVDVNKVDESPKESNEDKVAKPIKNDKYEGVKITPTTVGTVEELNEPQLQLTTSQSDIPLSSDTSKETDESNENKVKQSIDSEPSDDKVEKRNRRNTYRDGIKTGMKDNADVQENKKPATLLKSKPDEEKVEIAEELTTSQSVTGLYGDMIEVTTNQPTEGKDNIVEQHRQKRNTYGLMNTKEKLKENTAVPLKMKPEKETYLTGIESTTSAIDIALSTESIEQTTNQLSESENINEVERRKRHTYGLMKKDEIKQDDDKELKEKPATPLKTMPLEETTATESTTSQSGYEMASDEKEDELNEKPIENETEDNKVEEQHRRKRHTYGLMKKDEAKKDDDNELKTKPATPLKSKPLEETTATESTTSQSVYEIDSDKEEDELTELSKESGTEDNKVEEQQHRRRRNAYEYLKKSGTQEDKDKKLYYEKPTPLNSTPLEVTTPIILGTDLTSSQSNVNEETSSLESVVESTTLDEQWE